jgi:hypothetical protein
MSTIPEAFIIVSAESMFYTFRIPVPGYGVPISAILVLVGNAVTTQTYLSQLLHFCFLQLIPGTAKLGCLFP